jgi:hypothetical protein
MLKFKRSLAILMSGLSLQPLPSIVLSQLNHDDYQILDHYDATQKYFIETTKNELQHYKKINQDLIYLKEIKDLFGNNLYYLQFAKTGVIILKDYYETIVLDSFFEEKNFEQEIIYIPIIGLAYQKDEQYYSLESNELINDTDKFLEMKEGYLENLTENLVENKEIRDSFLTSNFSKQISNFSFGSKIPGSSLTPKDRKSFSFVEIAHS